MMLVAHWMDGSNRLGGTAQDGGNVGWCSHRNRKRPDRRGAQRIQHHAAGLQRHVHRVLCEDQLFKITVHGARGGGMHLKGAAH